jgi:hypothetical protein
MSRKELLGLVPEDRSDVILQALPDSGRHAVKTIDVALVGKP